MWLWTMAEAGRVGEVVPEQLIVGQEFLRIPPGSPSVWVTLGFLTTSQGQLDCISGLQMDKEKQVSWPFMMKLQESQWHLHCIEMITSESQLYSDSKGDLDSIF